MKRLVVFLLFASNLLSAQIKLYDTAYTVVTISPAQSFYLDSRIVSAVSGRSRLVIPVTLPEGTVRWFYSFAASESKNEPLEWVGLAGQLTRLVDKTGVAAEIINRMVKPTGTSACDIFVMDTEGGKFFEEKEDKKWQWDKSISRQSMTGGIVEAPVSRPRFLLGLSNPSLKTGINVKIEVSAVVAKSTPIYNANQAVSPQVREAAWTAEQREPMFQRIKSTFEGRTDPSVSEVTYCVLQKITGNFYPEEFKNRSASEQDIMIARMRKECLVELNKGELETHLHVADSLKQVVDFLEKGGNFPEMLAKTNELIDLGYASPSVLMRRARALLLNQRCDESIGILQNLAAQSPDNLAVQLNLAHAFLFKNQYETAEKQYVKFKSRQNTEGVVWEQMVNNDFNFFVENRLFNARYENIRKKLKIK